jgi:hypothetical protein
MVVAVRASGNALDFGRPAALFHIVEPVGPHAYPYDVAPDGQRILTLTPVKENGSAGLTVLLDWQAGLEHP